MSEKTVAQRVGKGIGAGTTLWMQYLAARHTPGPVKWVPRGLFALSVALVIGKAVEVFEIDENGNVRVAQGPKPEKTLDERFDEARRAAAAGLS